MWICKKKKHTMTVTLRNDNLSLTLMDKLTEANNTTRQVLQVGVWQNADSSGTHYLSLWQPMRWAQSTCQHTTCAGPAF